MDAMYPQFRLQGGPKDVLTWDGWLVPFGSRPLRRFHVLALYTPPPDDPACWILTPEISKRTWPRHRHLYAPGNLCTRYRGDLDWRYGRDDISQYMDTVVLWVGCHVHLEEFGWWPGPEAPGSEAHGPPNFKSDFGKVEWAAQRFIETRGLDALRQLLPGHGFMPMMRPPTPEALPRAG